MKKAFAVFAFLLPALFHCEYANPYVCGTTAYTVPTGYDYWQDLSGTVRSINETLPSFYIGLNPILLCQNSQCLP
jgi:hypothetical protein